MDGKPQLAGLGRVLHGGEQILVWFPGVVHRGPDYAVLGHGQAGNGPAAVRRGGGVVLNHLPDQLGIRRAVLKGNGQHPLPQPAGQEPALDLHLHLPLLVLADVDVLDLPRLASPIGHHQPPDMDQRQMGLGRGRQEAEAAASGVLAPPDQAGHLLHHAQHDHALVVYV